MGVGLGEVKKQRRASRGGRGLFSWFHHTEFASYSMALVEGNYREFKHEDFVEMVFPLLSGGEPNFVSDFC